MIDGLLLLVLSGMLVWLSIIDMRHFRLPDFLTLPLIGLGLIANWILDRDLIWSVAGALAGYLVFVGMEKAYKAIRGRDGLGRGDAKLLAAGGAWCGLISLPIIVLIASTAGLAFLLIRSVVNPKAQSDVPIAFGPFLSVGIFIAWLWQPLGFSIMGF